MLCILHPSFHQQSTLPQVLFPSTLYPPPGVFTTRLSLSSGSDPKPKSAFVSPVLKPVERGRWSSTGRVDLLKLAEVFCFFDTNDRPAVVVQITLIPSPGMIHMLFIAKLLHNTSFQSVKVTGIYQSKDQGSATPQSQEALQNTYQTVLWLGGPRCKGRRFCVLLRVLLRAADFRTRRLCERSRPSEGHRRS